MSVLILIGGILVAVLLYLYAHSMPAVYSGRSTVYTLGSGGDNSSPSSRINDLLGGSGGGSRTGSDDANVSIEEVARSRKTREAVVSERLPEFGNKTVGELLIREYDLYKTWRDPAIVMPVTDSAMASVASRIFQSQYSVKFNKNNLLEVVYSSTDKNLVVPVSNLLITKIAEFYKDLKIAKAAADFDFISAKVDSFRRVLNGYDRQRVAINNTTLFVPESKLQFVIPKENVNNDKLRVLAQHDAAANEREQALWRLQQVTPIIRILDKPAPPFSVDKPSGMIFGAAGFVIGCILFSLIFVAGILYRFAGTQLRNSLSEKPGEDLNVTTTA